MRVKNEQLLRRRSKWHPFGILAFEYLRQAVPKFWNSTKFACSSNGLAYIPCAMDLSPDAKGWLYEQFLDSKQRNAGTSLRSFAKKLGVSPSTISEVFHGKRYVTEKMALRFCKRLNLDPIQQESFIRSVKLTKSHAFLPDDATFNASTECVYKQIDLNTFSLLSEWHYFAILSLAEIKNNSCSSRWIAERLGISRAEARLAFNSLETAGLIQRHKTRFQTTGSPIAIETKGYEPAIKRFLKQHLEKAALSLDTTPAEEREISSMTLAIDPKNIEKARSMITRFRRELSAELEHGNQSRVYSLSMQLFPLDQKEHE